MPVTNDAGVVIAEIDDHLHHARKFTGFIYYVKTDGVDSALTAGLDPDTAFQSITYAVSRASAGDAITVKAGTYDETAGLDMNLQGLELWCEIGVIITNSTPGTVLTVSADYCRIEGPRLIQAGQIGLLVTSNRSIIDIVWSGPGNATGFDINGTANLLKNCNAGSVTTTGFDIGANGNKLEHCKCASTGGSTRGFYVSAGARVQLHDCSSIGNGTAGFELASGTSNCIVFDCASGAGDGTRVDLGTNNFWPGFVYELGIAHHEHLYPVSDGEGTAGAPVTISNSAGDETGSQDDQNYWGDVNTIIPVSTLTSDWRSLGIYIFATTAADIQQWQCFFPNTNFRSAKSGGNDWDEGETVLSVADGTVFLADDLVWATGTDRAAGEILRVVSVVGNVVTVESETRASGRTGMRWDYDSGAGGEMLYVVHRDTDTRLHYMDGVYSASGARDFSRYDWHEPKVIPANTGMIMRMLNATDAGASTFDVSAIYEDIV
jgi:hypothetical protein